MSSKINNAFKAGQDRARRVGQGRVDRVDMVVWQGGVGGASREELAREGNKSGGRAG